MALTKPLGGSPIQLHRTLDRVLDEAQNTGALVLSGQKLKEYPTIGDLPYPVDLSDLQSVDLSSNRLSEIPTSLCQCVRLESADFSGNVVRNVPTEIAALKFLRVLSLDRNLIFTLPPHLCRLRQLQILSVRSNKLVSIPDEIGTLDQLQELDLSCNELDRLPSGIFGLVNLRRLNVRRNNLIELPEVPATPDGRSCVASFLSGDVVASPSRLVSLDISSNRVQRLPLSMRHLKATLQSLVLDHNPLALPPAHVCKKGRLHVFKCLEKEYLKEKCKGEVINSLYQPTTPASTKHVRKSNSFGSALNGSKSYKMPAVQERFQKQQLQQQQRESKVNNQKKPRSHTVANGNVFKEAAEQHRLLQQQQQQQQHHLAPHQKAGTRDSGYHGAMDAESCWPGVSSTTPSSSSSPGGEEDSVSPSASWAIVGGGDFPRSNDVLNLQRHHTSSAATTSSSTLPDQSGGGINNNNNMSGSSNGGGMNSSGTLTPASPNTVTPPSVRHYINPNDGISPPRVGGNPFEGYSPPRDQHSLEDEFNKVMNKKFPNMSSSSISARDEDSAAASVDDDDHHHHHRTQRRQHRPSQGDSPVSVSSYPSPRSTHFQSQMTAEVDHEPVVPSPAPMASPKLNLDGSYQSTLSSSHYQPKQQPQQQLSTSAVAPTSAASPTSASSVLSAESTTDRMEREKTVVRIPIAEMAKPVLPPTSSSSSSSSSSASSTISRSSPNKQPAAGSGPKKNMAPSVKAASFSMASLTRTSSSSSKTGSPSRDSPAASSTKSRVVKASSADNATTKSSTRIPAFSSPSTVTPKSRFVASSTTVSRSSCSPSNEDKNNNKDVSSHNNMSASRTASYRVVPSNVASTTTPISNSRRAGEEEEESFDSSASSNFTIRREEQRLQEDVKFIRGMRSQLESRLKIQLPDSPPELSKSLADGVILCHLINHLRPRAVPTIHVPSATTPKLTYAKCARNVENFLEACRKFGVGRDEICAQNVVLEGRSVAQLARTVEALLRCASSSSVSGRRVNGAGGGGGGGAARPISRGYNSAAPSPPSATPQDLESDLTTVTQV